MRCAKIRCVAVFQHEVVLPGCSRDWFQQFVAEVHTKVEVLRFEGGRLVEELPEDQEVLLVAGRHAREGAEYRIGPEVGGFSLTITAWDRARGTSVRVLSREDEGIVTNSVTLRSANKPERVEVLGEFQGLRGPRLFRSLSWRVNISLTGWWEYLIAGHGPAPAVVDVTHPLATVRLEIIPRLAEGPAIGSWAVDVVGVVRGQSWARPLIAVGLRLIRRTARSNYRKALDGFAHDAGPVLTALTAKSPAAAAEAAVESLYAPRDQHPVEPPGKELT